MDRLGRTASGHGDGVEFRGLEYGMHIGHFYSGIAHLMTKVVPFVVSALIDGDSCWTVLTSQVTSKVTRSLRVRGFDLQDLHRSDRLRFIQPRVISRLLRSSPTDELEVRIAEEFGASLSRNDSGKGLRVVVDLMPVLEVPDYLSLAPVGEAVARAMEGKRVVLLSEHSFDREYPREVLRRILEYHQVWLHGTEVRSLKEYGGDDKRRCRWGSGG